MTGFGILGIDCMTFNVRQMSTFDINIRTCMNILGMLEKLTWSRRDHYFIIDSMNSHRNRGYKVEFTYDETHD